MFDPDWTLAQLVININCEISLFLSGRRVLENSTMDQVRHPHNSCRLNLLMLKIY